MKFLKEKNCKHFISFDVVSQNDDDNTEQDFEKDIQATSNIHEINDTQKYKIQGINISDIRLEDLVESLYQMLEPSNDLNDETVRQTFSILSEEQQRTIATGMLIYRYCIHRILTINKLWNPENWMYKTLNDYYGEEVDVIYIKPELADKVDSELHALIPKTNGKRIELILQLEYGHLINSVKNKEWGIAQSDIDHVIFTNQRHFQNCLEENYEYLKNYNLPRAITIRETVLDKKDGKVRYKLVDGYHRVCAGKDSPFLIIYANNH